MRRRLRVDLERALGDEAFVYVGVSSDRPFLVRDTWEGVAPGKMTERRCALAAIDDVGKRLCVIGFDKDGHYIGEEVHPITNVADSEQQSDLPLIDRPEFGEFMQRKFGFNHGPVHLHEFQADCGLSLHQFSKEMWQFILSAAEPEGTDEFPAKYPLQILDWVESGQCVLEWQTR
jgi:hypothetical protein